MSPAATHEGKRIERQTRSHDACDVLSAINAGALADQFETPNDVPFQVICSQFLSDTMVEVGSHLVAAINRLTAAIEAKK